MAPKARRARQQVPALWAAGFDCAGLDAGSLEAVTRLVSVSGAGSGCPGAGGPLGAAALAVLSGGSGLLRIRQPDQKQAHVSPKLCQNILGKGKI